MGGFNLIDSTPEQGNRIVKKYVSPFRHFFRIGYRVGFSRGQPPNLILRRVPTQEKLCCHRPAGLPKQYMPLMCHCSRITDTLRQAACKISAGNSYVHPAEPPYVCDEILPVRPKGKWKLRRN